MTAPDTDEYSGAVDWRLPADDIRRLSQLRPYYALLCVALEWAIIIAAAWISEVSHSWLVYVAAVIIIGSRLHAFGVLMHEAAHYRLSSNRQVNNAVGELLAWMILMTLQGYRNNHFAHHRDLNSDNDPDWVRKKNDPFFSFPKTPSRLLLDIFKSVSGVRFVVEMRGIFKSKDMQNIPARLKRQRLLFYIGVITVFSLSGHGMLLVKYWVVPYVTTFIFFMLIRSVAEHHGKMEYDHLLRQSRYVEPHWWERILIAPYGVYAHLDHHLYPSGPFYNLRMLHVLLMQQPEYRDNAHITYGYSTGLAAECL
ncbi:MAG: fatty acid desaturase family protein [Pseudomonadota bacterium]|nr:fatty acid desaturase family protein [Pseudomonadota bacterium]